MVDNRDAKSPKVPAFIDENVGYWLGALLTGRAKDLYTRMSERDANDYHMLKKALVTRYSFTEDGYRKRFRVVKTETGENARPVHHAFEELPSQAVRTFWKQFWRLQPPTGYESKGTVYQRLS